MIKQLRPYQQDCLNTLRQRLKQTTHPLLINASVGAGKSLILSELLLTMERAGYRSLCLTMNSTLIQQNHDTYKDQGGNPGIYCSGLKSKAIKNCVIFASPHSVAQSIRQKKGIYNEPFQLIIVDECHNISPHDNDSMYQRILNHYGFMAQQEQYSYRVVGLTGTPFRGKGISIVGPNEYFKEQVCSISTSWLIEQGFLTKPHFGVTTVDSIDFSDCRVNNLGQFKHKDLELALEKNERLTGEIMRELQTIKCNGIFIFASTKKHCEECSKSLPEGQWAIVTGDTPHAERKKILQDAANGILKYLISVGCLNVGVDLPFYDVCAWLRPTESLVLYTQGIGRVLRLYPNKSRALVLDYAGNLERHGDIDDPIINEALKPNEDNERDYIIPCYTCGTSNTIHARRCIGMVNEKRCDHFFEFKECSSCREYNDITSRQCRSCQAELIDPNAKLKRIKAETHHLNVTDAHYSVVPMSNTLLPIINISYNCGVHRVFESYYTNTPKNKNIFYAKFLRPHIENASQFYMHLSNINKMRELIESHYIKTPHTLVCILNDDGYYRIVKKMFD